MHPVIRMHGRDYDRSAAHDAQWQELELISASFYNTETCAREGKGVACASLRPVETFMRACTRPREAACLRFRKCANNCQLIVAGILRFLQHASAAHFHVIHTRKTQCALIYTQTLIGEFFGHGNRNTQECLTGG